jgi:hypothetical protein
MRQSLVISGQWFVIWIAAREIRGLCLNSTKIRSLENVQAYRRQGKAPRRGRVLAVATPLKQRLILGVIPA